LKKGGEMNLFNGMIQSLENTLNYTMAKHQAISSNISNVDTPNYHAKTITFKQALNDALTTRIDAKQTDVNHLPFTNHIQPPYRTVMRNQSTINHNGNNVDIDKEMAELAKNQIYYQVLVDQINGKFGDLHTVIRGGS
jgi:flagellar basal-body rod protein FlgB